MSVVAVHASADVGAPAERVWDVLVDWPRHDEWVPFTRAHGGTDVGAELVAWTGVGPVGLRDTMVVTEWRPPHRVGVRHTGRLVRGEGRFELVELPGGRCRVTWAERLEPPLGPLGRAAWLAVGPLARSMLTVSLGRLAKLFE